MKLIQTAEGKATIYFPEGEKKKTDVVFYNPEMRFNRDISVLALSVFAKEKKNVGHDLVIADVLSATGIRAVRYAKEIDFLNSSDQIIANDINPSAVKLIEKNVVANNISSANRTLQKTNAQKAKITNSPKITIANEDANLLLSKYKYKIDFVDIDPFGSPITFLDSAARSVSFHGMIAVTATDTAPLCGTYPEKCILRYGSKPMRNELMHEVGLRIIIKTAITECAKYEKAFIPVLSFADKHYFRIFGKVLGGKKLLKQAVGAIGYLVYCNNCKNRFFVKNLLELVCTNQKCKNADKKTLDYAGPLYIGKLFDSDFIQKMYKLCDEEAYFSDDVFKFLEFVKNESKINGTIYNLHEIFGGTSSMPTTKEILQKLKKQKIKASVSHLGGHIIRAEAYPL